MRIWYLTPRLRGSLKRTPDFAMIGSRLKPSHTAYCSRDEVTTSKKQAKYRTEIKNSFAEIIRNNASADSPCIRVSFLDNDLNALQTRQNFPLPNLRGIKTHILNRIQILNSLMCAPGGSRRRRAWSASLSGFGGVWDLLKRAPRRDRVSWPNDSYCS